MNHNSRISKMFGALVLGGGMLIQPTEAEAEPNAQEPTTKPKPKESTAQKTAPSAKVDQTAQTKPIKRIAPPPSSRLAKSKLSPPEAQRVEHCQLDFTLYTYDREGIVESQQSTCLDNKSDAEILSIIKKAKEQTCNTPFCGCWLG